MIYLDSNATTPIKPAVRTAMAEAMERHGNPSSVHRYGRIARRYMDDARAKVAALVGAKPFEVIFTSSGSEANNLVLSQFVCPIVSSIEHESVLSFSAPDKRLPVLMDGRIDLYAAERILMKCPKGSLVSVMLVNHETGVIQPLAALSYLTRKFGHFLHVDAVQAAGRMPLNFASMGVDALTLSAHKIGGPQGMGALVIKESISLDPLIRGGGQEQGRRSGTENVAGVIGFGVAAQLAADDLRDTLRLQALRDKLQHRIVSISGGDAIIIGEHAPRVANTLLVALPGLSGEAQVASMDLAGVAVSAGSACSSGKARKSHVLTSMGYEPQIAGCVMRISLGWHSIAKDIDRCAEAWSGLYQRARTTRTTRAA